MSGSIYISMTEYGKVVEERGKSWECDFSKQFPISHIDNHDDKTIVTIGPPHMNYQIITHLKNKKLDGESTLISDKKIIVATLTFVDGIANGPCMIYDEDGVQYFKGNMVNGYRQGRGKEYDEKGKLVYEGFYDQGKKLIKMAEMSGYWKKYDDSNKLISICRKDSNGKNDGLCYFYYNGVFSKISEWHGGVETTFNGYFKIYDEPQKKWIEGYYENGRFLNMVRLSEMDGYWLEYDENNQLKSICKKDRQGRYEGICYFYDHDVMIRISEWHEGKEKRTGGHCEVYDEPNHVWYEGGFENGVRNGKCIEYNDCADIIYKGYYINGNKLVAMKGWKNYWKEKDGDGNTVRICQINENGRYEGISYIYINDEISRVSRWEDGKEIEVIKTFCGNMMTEYKNGKKRYEGGFANSLELNYQREGQGEEYDNDGQALIYKGSYKNGKRSGQGKMYKNMKLDYDGEWIIGLRKSQYYTYMALIFAIMIIIASACFYFVNSYVGLIVSGLFISTVCFYFNKKIGVLATGLLIVMSCYFLHYYAGIISTILLIVTISFYLMVEVGIIVTGLVVIIISYMLNIHIGIFTSGLLAIYIVYLIVNNRNWKLNIVYSSAGLLLGMCCIISLIIEFDQNGLTKYLLLIIIGLYLIYILYLIVFYMQLDKSILYTGIIVIITGCILTGLIFGLIGNSALKYVLIFGIGEYSILILYVICVICKWEMEIVWISGGVIFGVSIIIDLVMGSFEVSFLKYVVIGVIGIGLMILCYVLYWDKDKEIVYTGIVLIFISSIMTGLIFGLINIKGLKYVLIFGIGSYIALIIYIICVICQWEIKYVWISGSVIFGLCTFVDLVIGSFEVSFLKFIIIGVIGIGLMILIYDLYWDKDKEIVYTGIISILISSITTGLIFGLIGSSALKYVLIFGIGSYIELIIYIICAICKWKKEKVVQLGRKIML